MKSVSQRTSTVYFHVFEESKIVKLVGSESQMLVARSRGKGKWGVSVQVLVTDGKF